MTRLKPGTRSHLAGALLVLAMLASLVAAACAQSVAANTDDASITARVRTVLMNDTQIDALKIGVETSSGVVTISGVVRSPDEVDRALNLTRQVEGVRDVRSSLQVNPAGS